MTSRNATQGDRLRSAHRHHTLVHRFFAQTSDYDSAGTGSFGLMARDFFEFLKNEPDKEYYLALGSNQRVKVHARFHPKAAKAYNRCLEAIADEGKASANKKWREVFGSSVPLKTSVSARSFDDTEQFIEDRYPVDIDHSVTIGCEVTQAGFRPTSLREMLRGNTPLMANKALRFEVTSCTATPPYEVKWKVLNRGPVAERRNNIRGQIIDSNEPSVRKERTSFRGAHVVVCFVVKDGVVVARDRIGVPIHDTSATVSAPDQYT